MTVEINYNFDSASDYDFDPTYIQVVGGSASLKLAPDTGQSFIEDFADDTGFTYDSSLAGFSGGILSQTSKRPANATFGATFTSSINASWGDSASLLPVSTVGSPVISGGYIDLSTGKNAIYDVGNCYAPLIGAIKFKLKPAYSGTPASIQQFFYMSKPDTTQLLDGLVLQHETTGNLTITAYSQFGAGIGTDFFGTFSPTAGQEYEIELNWDYSTGAQRLFIDGVQKGSTVTRTGNRGGLSATSELRIGGTSAADFAIADLVLFSAIQHTAGYTPGYALEETDYRESTATLPTFVYGGLGNIQAFISVGITGAGTPVNHYTVNGKYWDGGAWVVSDGSWFQGNSLTVLNAHIGSLAVSDSVIMQVVFPSSNSKAQIDELSFNYTGQAYFTGQSITPNVGIPVTEVTSVAEASTVPAGQDIKYAVEIDSQPFYWNGSAWVASSGFAQSNTFEELEANLASLPILPTGSFVRPRIYFESDGTATASIDTFGLSVLYDINPIAKPQRTIIFGSLLDMVGLNLTGKAWLRIVNEDQFFIENNSIQPDEVSVAANSEGVASAVVVATGSIGYKYAFYIDYIDEKGKKRTKTLGRSVAPNEIITNIANLTFEAIP